MHQYETFCVELTTFGGSEHGNSFHFIQRPDTGSAVRLARNFQRFLGDPTKQNRFSLLFTESSAGPYHGKWLVVTPALRKKTTKTQLATCEVIVMFSFQLV